MSQDEAPIGRTPAQPTALHGEGRFLTRVAIVAGVFVVGAALYALAYVVLLAFLAVLLAVIVRALVALVERIPGIGPRGAFALSLLLLLGGLVGLGATFATTIQGQLGQVFTQLPEAIEAIGRRVGIEDPVGKLEDQIRENAGAGLVGRAANLGAALLGALVDAIIVLLSAIYLAYDPRLYRRGLVRLFPPSQRDRIETALVTTGSALRLWFGGQLVSMAFVGVATGLGFWWLGLPAPAALGLIAGLTNFVPFVGPLIGSAPAVIFALDMGLETVAWTIGLVLVVQQIESDVVVPIVQRRAVDLPPALALFAILAAGLLWGFLGVFLAVPMAVALMVLIKMLWIREALGEPTTVPGETR